MSDVDFCKRNARLWVGCLAVASVLVLVYAVWAGKAQGTSKGVGFGGGSRGASQDSPAPGSIAPVPVPSPVAAVAAPSAAGHSLSPIGHSIPSFTHAVDRVRPSVVNINAVRRRVWSRPVGNPGPTFIDPFDGVPDKLIGNRPFESVGSGVIVDAAGFVLTNNHIIAGATSIVVSRFGRHEHLPARVVAVAPRKDLALLKLDGAGGFPAVTFADSSKVEVGDWVLTVGNPFGLQQTVTSGIISGTERRLAIDGVLYRGLLQTDAPINPGSSGGALANTSGQVIGITTAIYAPTGVFSGAGFAIPSNQASAFVARALAHGQSVPVAMPRPAPKAQPRDHLWLGIGVIDVTDALAKKIGYPHLEGAFVSSVTPGSLAGEAGIRRGDVITSIGGRLIHRAGELQSIVARLKLGLPVATSVWRNGKTKRFELSPANQ